MTSSTFGTMNTVSNSVFNAFARHTSNTTVITWACMIPILRHVIRLRICSLVKLAHHHRPCVTVGHTARLFG